MTAAVAGDEPEQRSVLRAVDPRMDQSPGAGGAAGGAGGADGAVDGADGVDGAPTPASESIVPADVVREAAAGDTAAVDAVLAAVAPVVRNYCRSRIGRWDRSFCSADDVAQEVCIAVLRALPGYVNQGKPFLAFVYGIAQHKVADAHRAARRVRADPMPDVPDSDDRSPGPEDRALAGEFNEQIAALLRSLPERQQEILRLRVVLGWSAEQTADAVGATAGAVRVAQHRALARLREHPMLAELVHA